MNSTIVKLDTKQVARAVVLCLQANVPVALWGAPGWGKSSVFRQIADGLAGYKFYDFRLSDKEPSDIGGIPMPDHKTGKMRFAVADTLPFDCDEKAIVCLDEFDRADLSVQNVALQLILDRQVNSHKLSPNARIVLAGNGVTDVGTSPLSKAAANRICHLYLDTESEGCFEAWTSWAEKAGMSHELCSFAKYKRDCWKNDAGEPEQLAYPTPRSFEMADKLFAAAGKVSFKTGDVMRALICGCVGQAAGTELIAWRTLCKDAPTIEEVIAAPDTAKIPTVLGVTYSLTLALLNFCTEAKNEKHAEKVLRYGIRLGADQAAFLIQKLVTQCPTLATTQAYLTWEKSQRP